MNDLGIGRLAALAACSVLGGVTSPATAALSPAAADGPTAALVAPMTAEPAQQEARREMRRKTAAIDAAPTAEPAQWQARREQARKSVRDTAALAAQPAGPGRGAELNSRTRQEERGKRVQQAAADPNGPTALEQARLVAVARALLAAQA